MVKEVLDRVLDDIFSSASTMKTIPKDLDAAEENLRLLREIAASRTCDSDIWAELLSASKAVLTELGKWREEATKEFVAMFAKLMVKHGEAIEFYSETTKSQAELMKQMVTTIDDVQTRCKRLLEWGECSKQFHEASSVEEQADKIEQLQNENEQLENEVERLRTIVGQQRTTIARLTPISAPMMETTSDDGERAGLE
jgi:predicted ribosome quality control (RQC) complex YloA/Tae2 family protein